MKRSPMPTKRPPQTTTERHARTLVKQRSNGLCELGCGNPAREVHHRLNRSQGGTWAVSNLLHLCSRHHGYITEHPAAAKKWGWTVRRFVPAPFADSTTAPVHLNGVWVLLGDDGTVEPTEGDAA